MKKVSIGLKLGESTSYTGLYLGAFGALVNLIKLVVGTFVSIVSVEHSCVGCFSCMYAMIPAFFACVYAIIPAGAGGGLVLVLFLVYCRLEPKKLFLW